MKVCTKCGVEKPLTDFSKSSRNKDGRGCWCKVCHSEASRKWEIKNPGKHRASRSRSRLKWGYGLTPEDKEGLIVAQKERCAICKNPFTNSFQTHVDHIHDSEPPIVRGILCHHCNFGLGNFKDSTERLASAIEYLKKFQK